jgi:hypothetical protein
MKHAIALAAAAGLASVLALPASAETNQRGDGLRSKAQATHKQVEHTDVSSRRYYRNYGYRAYRPYRYGYYRPYRPYYYGPYAYGPGVSFGFGGGPRLGVWF